MFCISIGYPLETGVNFDGMSGFIVERCTGQQLFISKSESILWSKLLIGGTAEKNEDLENLIKKGLVIAANNHYQLLYQLSSLTLIRQGMGVHVKEDNDISFQVYIGKKSFSLNNTQKVIWCNADGDKNFSKITELLIQNNLTFSEDKLFKDVCGLAGCGLLFFKNIN